MLGLATEVLKKKGLEFVKGQASAVGDAMKKKALEAVKEQIDQQLKRMPKRSSVPSTSNALCDVFGMDPYFLEDVNAVLLKLRDCVRLNKPFLLFVSGSHIPDVIGRYLDRARTSSLMPLAPFFFREWEVDKMVDEVVWYTKNSHRTGLAQLIVIVEEEGGKKSIAEDVAKEIQMKL